MAWTDWLRHKLTKGGKTLAQLRREFEAAERGYADYMNALPRGWHVQDYADELRADALRELKGARDAYFKAKERGVK